jgi:nucleoside-diphosphate-sugar epimerase
MNNEAVLITGASGFLGSILVGSFSHHGYNVLGLDLKLPRVKENNATVYQVLIADITRPGTLPEKIRQATVLVHCAALVHRGSKDLSRANYFRVNYGGTRNVLHALDPSRLKRVVFLSTVSVYGLPESGQAVSEQARPMPLDDYGSSKLAAENEVQAFSRERAIPCTIFRLAPVYAKDFLLNIRKRTYLPGRKVFYKIGNGDQRISMSAAGNVVEAVRQSVEQGRLFDGIFNLKDRVDYSVNDIIGVVRKLDGHPYLPVMRIPKWLATSLTVGMMRLSPARGAYLRYQLRKIAMDSTYSGDKLFHAGFEPRWDLSSELLGKKLAG